MTRLLQPPEGGWRGRLSFIQQILRSAFRLPDRTDPSIGLALDRIDPDARRGSDEAEADTHVAGRPGSGLPPREGSEGR